MVQVEVTPIEEDERRRAAAAHDIVLGQGQAMPDLEERIMELAAGRDGGHRRPVPRRPPRRGAARARSARSASALHEVKRQELPPLDDAFAREVGDFETLDALRAAVRADLEPDAEREADAQVRDAADPELVEANGVAGPARRWCTADSTPTPTPYGIPHETASREVRGRSSTPIAEAQVRRDLVLDAVVGAGEALRPPRRRSTRGSRRWRPRAACRPARSTRSSQKAERLPELERGITEEKVFAWLLSQSTVVEAKS